MSWDLYTLRIDRRDGTHQILKGSHAELAQLRDVLQDAMTWVPNKVILHHLSSGELMIRPIDIRFVGDVEIRS